MDYAVKEQPDLKDFFIDNWNKQLDRTKIDSRTNKPTYNSAAQRTTLNGILFDALGSTHNKDALLICDDNINSDKARVWDKIDASSDKKFADAVDDAISGHSPSTKFLSAIRTVSLHSRQVIFGVGYD